jgi:hypothetical protein
LKRLFVATIEWLRLCPNAGPLPQTAHTFGIAEQCSGLEGAGPYTISPAQNTHGLRQKLGTSSTAPTPDPA